MTRDEKIKNIAKEREYLDKKMNELVKQIENIAIASKSLLPFGWRKAAKGRTVWRIVEEVISQNLEFNAEVLGFRSIIPADSEVGVYDFEFQIDEYSKSFVNIKSAVTNTYANKDDISKATGLIEFIENNIQQNLYIATFFINFSDSMEVEIQKCVVFPIAWIPDVYINPSNNGNLQSKDYKYLEKATYRTNEEFLQELKAEQKIALIGGRTTIKKTVSNMLDKGLNKDDVANQLNLSVDQIEEFL